MHGVFIRDLVEYILRKPQCHAALVLVALFDLLRGNPQDDEDRAWRLVSIHSIRRVLYSRQLDNPAALYKELAGFSEGALRLWMEKRDLAGVEADDLDARVADMMEMLVISVNQIGYEAAKEVEELASKIPGFNEAASWDDLDHEASAYVQGVYNIWMDRGSRRRSNGDWSDLDVLRFEYALGVD